MKIQTIRIKLERSRYLPKPTDLQYLEAQRTTETEIELRMLLLHPSIGIYPLIDISRTEPFIFQSSVPHPQAALHKF